MQTYERTKHMFLIQRTFVCERTLEVHYDVRVVIFQIQTHRFILRPMILWNVWIEILIVQCLKCVDAQFVLHFSD